MELEEILKEIKKYENKGWEVAEGNLLDSYIIAPSGSCYGCHTLVFDGCAICAQYEDAGEETACFHDDELIDEMEEARKLAKLENEKRRLEFAKHIILDKEE